MVFGGDSMWIELQNRSGLTPKEVSLEEENKAKGSTEFDLLF